MLLLFLASLVWAFSFGLLGHFLAGLSPAFIAGARLTLAALVFLPFIRRLPLRQAMLLMVVGAVQFGVMYLFYNAAFACLPGHSHAVAMLTVFTPLYVTLLHDAWRMRLSVFALIAALVAVLGAGVLLWTGGSMAAPLHAFLLVQASNICFAIGQIFYRDWSPCGNRPADHNAMAWLYIGGALITLPWAIPAASIVCSFITLRQVLVLVYLGLVASGLGFFLWNAGARRTSPGLLAVVNNLKIPLATAASLFVFHEHADPLRLSMSCLILSIAVILGRIAAKLNRQGD